MTEASKTMTPDERRLARLVLTEAVRQLRAVGHYDAADKLTDYRDREYPKEPRWVEAAAREGETRRRFAVIDGRLRCEGLSGDRWVAEGSLSWVRVTEAYADAIIEARRLAEVEDA